MLHHVRKRATYANVVATLALMLSLAGTSIAAGHMITGQNVRNNSLTGADIRNRSLTGSDVKPNSIGAGQVGIIGPSDIRNNALTDAHLAASAKVQLPLQAIDRILIGLNNASQTLESVGPLTLAVPAGACTANGVTLRITTAAENVVLDGDTDFDPAEASDYLFPISPETKLITATTSAGDSYGIIVQGGLVANQCSVSGIVVQGGRTPSRGIIVQGG